MIANLRAILYDKGAKARIRANALLFCRFVFNFNLFFVIQGVFFPSKTFRYDKYMVCREAPNYMKRSEIKKIMIQENMN